MVAMVPKAALATMMQTPRPPCSAPHRPAPGDRRGFRRPRASRGPLTSRAEPSRTPVERAGPSHPEPAGRAAPWPAASWPAGSRRAGLATCESAVRHPRRAGSRRARSARCPCALRRLGRPSRVHVPAGPRPAGPRPAGPRPAGPRPAGRPPGRTRRGRPSRPGCSAGNETLIRPAPPRRAGSGRDETLIPPAPRRSTRRRPRNGAARPGSRFAAVRPARACFAPSWVAHRCFGC